jgi:hypothetical protein
MFPKFLRDAYDAKTNDMSELMKERILSLTEYSAYSQSKNIPVNRRLIVDDKIEYINTSNTSFLDDLVDGDFKSEPLPYFISNIDDYFTISFSGNEQKLHAIMTANDPTWIVFPKSTQNKILYNLKISLSTEFSKLYKFSVFRHYKIINNENDTVHTRDSLYNSLMRDDVDITESYLHLISEYLNVNIAQVYSCGYDWVSYFKPERATIILWTYGEKSGCVLHSSGTKHLHFDNLQILQNLVHINPERTLKMNIELYPERKKYLSELKKLKKIDIQNIAEKKKIEIYYFNSKNKSILITKDSLIQSIMNLSFS